MKQSKKIATATKIADATRAEKEEAEVQRLLIRAKAVNPGLNLPKITQEMTRYQVLTNLSILDHHSRGTNRLLARLFTGAGKTSYIAAKLPLFLPDLAKHGLIFISHRREILYHSYRTFKEIFAGTAWCGIDMGEMEATGFEDFIFMSVDSMGRLQSDRILKYKRIRPGIIVVDEGHHPEEDGIWDNVLNFFGVGSDKTQHYRLSDGQKPLSLFLTATPRPDRMAPFIDAVAADFGIEYGMREGFLTDIKLYRASPRKSDYEQWDEDAQVDFLVKTWQQHVEGQRTLAFARNVAQSQLLANTLNEHKICRAGHVDAKTKDDERKKLVKAFGLPYDTDDSLDFMTNRGIFLEGYDNRYIQCILDNAPANQRTTIQKIGRGLRPSPDADIYSCTSAEERREAIRRSSKPYLTYITTFPLEHDLDIASKIFDVPKTVKADGVMLLAEIVDVIENEEKEMPEAPFREAAGIASVDVRLERQDVWTKTIYNEEIITLSKLRWIVDDNWAAIFVPENVTSNEDYDQTPIIIFHEMYGSITRSSVITFGGWNETLGHPVKPRRRTLPQTYANLTQAIKMTDKALSKHEVVKQLQRAHSGPATQKIKNYLKNKKVRFNDNLTMETAELLRDHARIHAKLTEMNLINA